MDARLTRVIAGVDEAGRGPLAGPVIAAAVILNPDFEIPGLTDSKKLSEKQRDALFPIIQANVLAWSIGRADVHEIDTLNILHATMLAMKRAVEGLSISPHLVLIDGNRAPILACEAQTIIKGDLTEPAISAASILAKVTRDKEMLQLHELYPQYNFAKHKGYGTKEHLAALEQHGITKIHRRFYAPIAKFITEVA